MDYSEITNKIDHTLLKPEAGIDDIKYLCNEAIEFGFYSVCINSAWLRNAFDMLIGSSVKLCTVAGFPLGASSKFSKLYEVESSIQNGASEIDMVMNIGFLKDKKYNLISDEISEIVKNADGKVIKVIIESGLLNKEEIKLASQIAEDSGANFIKTSTGFSKFGASIEVIQIIKEVINTNTKIKASGGINKFKQIKDLVNIGVDRIGTSSGAIIMKEIQSK